VKQFAVLVAVWLLLAEKAAQVDRRFARGQGIPSRRMAIARHVSLGVIVIFAEGDADRHIQQMPDRAAAIDRRCQFRDVVDHPVIRIEQAALAKNSSQRSANRLAHGEHDMRRGRAHAVAVPLRRESARA